MRETEGVIKFELDHRDGPAPTTELGTLNAWRTVLHRLGLVGQVEGRYGGYGFGNVSVRDGAGFLISGTQTGRPENLDPDAYVAVLDCDPAANRIISQGRVKPSSESLTHGAIYTADSTVGCVLHAHSPEIWQRIDELGLPATPADVAYGTPAMAETVATLLADSRMPRPGVFATRGHEDGVFAFGSRPDDAGMALVGVLARALALAS